MPCGFKLANDGHDTRAIQPYLGHRSIMSTVRYTALMPNRFKNFWKDLVSNDDGRPLCQLRGIHRRAVGRGLDRLGRNHNRLGPDSGSRNRTASIRIELCPASELLQLTKE